MAANETNITSRVSVDSSGIQGNRDSSDPSISADGRYVTFNSFADNLVSGGTNDDSSRVFTYDRQTNTISRVPLDYSGLDPSTDPTIASTRSVSEDGRYAAFFAFADNLVSGDTNGVRDVFVYDRLTSTTSRVSVDSRGIQGNRDSLNPSISADGRYVAFYSFANNLVSGDTNDRADVFLFDRQTNTTIRVSVDSSGTQGNGDSLNPSISADGRYVAFQSFGNTNNLVSGDTNDRADVFVYDQLTSTTSRVSVDSSGTQGNDNSYSPSISADGRYVAFDSLANNLVSGDTNNSADVFVYDRQTNTTSRVSVDSSGTQGNNASYDPSISADGRAVAFYSYSDNLVSGDTNGSTDVFVYQSVDRAANNGPTVVSPLADQTTSEDAAFSLQFPANAFNDVDGDSLRYLATLANDASLPSWLSFDALSRTFSGTPTNSDVGSLSIKLTARDAAGASASDTFDLAITNINDDPTVANFINNQIAIENVAFSLTVDTNTFSDVDAGDTLTYGASLEDDTALPGWLSFDAASRTFSGTPTNSDRGTLNIEVTATDSSDASVSDSFELTVASPPVNFNPDEGDDSLIGGNTSDTLDGGQGNDTLTGNDGNDSLDGGSGNDTLSGDQGDDVLNGSRDNDALTGNFGNDSLDGGSGNDTLDGGQGDDVLKGSKGDDFLTSGDGNDSLDSGSSNDSLVGGQGNDTLDGVSGNDTLDGGQGDDVLRGSKGDDILIGNDGNDSLDGGSSNDSLVGGQGNDTLDGVSGNDTLDGGQGDDVLRGSKGDDSLTGSFGNDSLDGGSSNDSLVGGQGNDTLDGVSGNDTLDGAQGDDTLNGSKGDDVLNGSFGNDSLDGGSGNDDILGGLGNDTLKGSEGDDALFSTFGNSSLDGGSGNDDLFGGGGSDSLDGGSDNDDLFGGGGSDSLNGGSGRDILTGVSHNAVSNVVNPGSGEIDILTGGSASDQFILGDAAQFYYYNDGNNADLGLNDYALIVDFQSEEDSIQLYGSQTSYSLTESPFGLPIGTAVFYQTPDQNELVAVLQGVSGLSLDNGAFTFVG